MTITDFLFSWLVRSAFLGLLILLVGSGAVLTFRQPVRRLRIIELVLWASLLAPFLGMVPGYPRLSVVALRSVATKPPESSLPPAIDPITGPTSFHAADRGARPVLGNNSADAPIHALNARPWIVAAYLAGVALAIGWWLVGLVGLLRVLRTAKPAPPRCHELLAEITGDCGDRVRLLTSRWLKQPFATVWGRATIVLPADLCSDERALRWCLAHEWAHVARHDFRAWLLAGLARALFFYQPLVWWLRRQLRLCQDFLADAQVAGQASQAEDYAEFLTLLAAKGKWRPAALGLSMRSGKSELYRRVIMLLKNQPLEDRAPRFWTVSATAAAVVLAALTAAISIAPRAVAEEKPANKQTAKNAASTPGATVTKSVQYTETRDDKSSDGKSSGPKTETRVLILGGYLKREERKTLTSGDKLEGGAKWVQSPANYISIFDAKTGKTIMLLPESKRFAKFETISSVSPDDGSIKTERIKPLPKVDFYEETRRLPDGKLEKLPARTIGGKQSTGFRFVEKNQRKQGTDTWTRDIWIDPATKLPFCIEVTEQSTDPRMGRMHAVLSDFVWDAPLEQQLFSTDPPEGYTKMK